MSDQLLVADKLTRRFGGLSANEAVSLTLTRGRLHALLGPNGAGKSTCINMLSGDLPPSEGRIYYQGRDITALDAPQRSRVGIGRSYQRTNIFPGFTVLENCRLAAQSRHQRAWRLFANALGLRDTLDKAHAVMAEVGLEAQANRIAGTLSHGEQRQLEIAMVLATDADVLLLDEPLAGMGSEEASRMVGLLDTLRRSRAILLVEHDMDAVFAVADEITVLVNGQLLATGTPAQIRSNHEVQQAYLGEEAFHA
ncbi:ABC transporter ATP-binding protein [Denitromonas iodatirespirans]|uniref:ABC transporter ATP-binding protein n=1 Tax=Denitromonas iodatirespirans TaxID=2795389 RepID=A0A944DBN9_DENI1|nr:ABC transporter ATP-binding protein [Denitromonas iodatirespirans]MBT0963825.1 ABC transporter ATP-binding protein [Denitromonas iodatirespirans]